MAKRGWAALWRMTPGEYGANLAGLNTLFGAVLGIVLSGTDTLSSWDFGLLLFVSAAMVITILYVSSSPHRLAYAALAAGSIAALPWVVWRLIGKDALPPHLQPTLAVWLAFTVLVEVMPRERSSANGEGS
jgi:hypothetical protein